MGVAVEVTVKIELVVVDVVGFGGSTLGLNALKPLKPVKTLVAGCLSVSSVPLAPRLNDPKTLINTFINDFKTFLNILKCLVTPTPEVSFVAPPRRLAISFLRVLMLAIWSGWRGSYFR